MQAEIIRDFIAEAERRGIEYNIVEAFDQTWKTNEGSVGAYWGMFDADRNAKFPLTGLVETHDVVWKAAAGLAIGLAADACWACATAGRRSATRSLSPSAPTRSPSASPRRWPIRSRTT